MKILLVNYGIEKDRYVSELIDDLQTKGYQVDCREDLISGLTSVYTNNYIAVLLILKDKQSEGELLSEFLKYLKEETHLKVVVVSNEENIKDLDGDIFLPYGISGNIIVKNIESGIVKEKKQKMVDYNKWSGYNLTKTETIIMKELLKNPNKTVSREELLNAIGYEDSDKNLRIIDVHIKNIRDKVQTDHIRTIRGIGYKWVEY